MAEIKQQPGTAIASPEPKYKWISIQEAEKFEKFLRKSFVPKDDEKFAKKFFYRVESIIPYTPAGNYGPEMNRYKFLLQKYYRDKMEVVSVATDAGGTQEVERNKPVEGHVLTENGFWSCVNSDASITMDCEEFKSKFVPDNKVD